ncbi:sugar ABC transporter ATP-binding protein [Naasia lichenicola]|uniref:Sugar ABC transporter ATP-binding protein n=1 Tax=Naasia lichenicola TaxID=2565933 RepID=A0A4S4FMB9_9MICO|nr:sugar ABC transporter ATP-binding protein [Naasia lichenicola]THG31573.1 sugar ABC transporter ATP-binding protein [Naasia lichenicola]
MSSATDFPLLRLSGLDKTFFATRAAHQVSFDVHQGEIVSLLGENGAGKSTVIKMLAGVYRPDAGQILLNGAELGNADSRKGISFVHQNLGLVEWMTVAENIAQTIGYPTRLGLISPSRMRERALEVLDLIGGGIDPDARVFSLPRTERSLLAIARGLINRPKVLVLDEPTASLPAADVQRLFDVLRRLRDTGVGMIYVSHRLDEIYEISTRAVVMRNGEVVADRAVADLSHFELVDLIVGSATKETVFDPPRDRVRLSIEGLVVAGVGPVDLSVREGEVLALCGLRGAGQEQIGRSIAGDLIATAGTYEIDGEVARIRSVASAIDHGIGFSTSNRETEAVAPGMSVRENLFLNPAVWGRRLWQFRGAKSERLETMPHIDSFGVRPRDPEIALDTLSGGNQQKVILARWFGVGRKVIVLEEPTMGVDVGAKADIYALLRDVTRAGTSVIVVSTDMEEVAKVAHRAIVFGRGRMVAEIHREDLSIGSLVAAASNLASTTASGGSNE